MSSSISIRETLLVDRLHRMSRELVNFKNLQYTGRLNMVSHETTAPLVKSTLHQAGWQDANYIVTFTAHSQKAPYGRLGLIFYNEYNNPITDTDYLIGSLIEAGPNKGEGEIKWILSASTRNNTTIPFSMRVIVTATDTGVIKMDKIS